MQNDLLIRGGRIVDPSQGLDLIADLLVRNGTVEAISPNIEVQDIPVLDASGKVVMPGFIDMHVHLREPGFEEKEDIQSGTRAAAMGGFTAVACMPNTEPPCDNDTVVSRILRRANEVGVVKVYPIGAVTKGREGKELAEMGEMRKAGAVAFSDDGNPVSTAEVLRCALEYLKTFDCVLIDHPEDLSLSRDGQMHLGFNSTVAGLRGIPAEAEEVAVARDLLVARLTKGRLHLAHISTAGSVELVRRAKEQGINVTCEVTPHHLVLTDEAVLKSGYDTNTKVNPPLRSAADVEALRSAVADGIVDCIATDHAPHHFDDKWVEYDYAPPGIVGLETAVGLIVDALVVPGRITWNRLAEIFSVNPARILGVRGGSLRPGSPADITIVDPDCERPVDPRKFESKGKNTPFGGMRLIGAPWATVVDGRLVMKGGQLMV